MSSADSVANVPKLAAGDAQQSGPATALAAGPTSPVVSLPVGFTVFPGETFRAARGWIENECPNLSYFHEVDTADFAVWGEPVVFLRSGAQPALPFAGRRPDDAPQVRDRRREP
jgi:hypothetical protein